MRVVMRTECFQAMPLGSGRTKAIDPMLSDGTPLEARPGTGCCRLPVRLTGFARGQAQRRQPRRDVQGACGVCAASATSGLKRTAHRWRGPHDHDPEVARARPRVAE